jgi:putative transposase
MTYHAPIPRPSIVAITLRLTDPSSDLLVRHVRLLRDCVALAQKRWDFGIEAAVVLPNELQLLGSFADDQSGVGGAIRLIRSTFARHLPESGVDIWNDDVEVLEVSRPVVALRRTFMEMAPVRAGMVRSARDWPFSSAHKDVVQGTATGVAVA